MEEILLVLVFVGGYICVLELPRSKEVEYVRTSCLRFRCVALERSAEERKCADGAVCVAGMALVHGALRNTAVEGLARTDVTHESFDINILDPPGVFGLHITAQYPAYYRG
ncbi:hypothetical protein PspLS_10970 [Pyricularia sp. CBS 133598]|nr:hypothetical protein PspLS_10970 [Pyricularia sp. CBS 133598]